MKCLSSEERLVEEMRKAHPSITSVQTDYCPVTTRVRRRRPNGFTMLELLIVVFILGIAALTAVPMMSSAGSVQVRSAAHKIAADLAYAKSLAISRGQDYSVVFDVATESYQIEDLLGIVVPHPVKKGSSYTVDLTNEGLDRVDVTVVDFNGNPNVTFDPLGSPDNGGTITVTATGLVMTVSVEPVTGYISVK